MMNTYILLRATIIWLAGADPTAGMGPEDPQYCDAVVVCQPHAQSCDVLVWGECRWTLDACLDSEVKLKDLNGGAVVPTLGCAPHGREAVVDAQSVRRAAAPARRRGR